MALAMLGGSDSKVGGVLKGGNGQRVGAVKKGSMWEAKRILKAGGSWALNFDRWKHIKNTGSGHSKQTEEVPREQRCRDCGESWSARAGREHTGERKGKPGRAAGPRSSNLLSVQARTQAWPRGPQGGSEGSGASQEDSKPESNQDGNGHEEGHDGDAMAQGVDDLHGGEVGFLGE